LAIADHSFYIPGDSRGVLLIHGLTGTPAEMKFVGRHLAAAGFTVYGMQLAGHCGTEHDLLRTTWRDWRTSVERAHDRLARHCDCIFAGGLSMGALLALHLAARRPRQVAGIALYSTTLWHDGWSVPLTHRLLPLVLRLPGTGRFSAPERHPYGLKDERMRQMIVSQMMSGQSGAAGLAGMPFPSLLEMRRLTSRVKRELPRIRTPALVLHALHDDISSVRNARYLERRLGGPVVTQFLNDSYHMITVDRQRTEVVRRSLEFFGACTCGQQEHYACVPA